MKAGVPFAVGAQVWVICPYCRVAVRVKHIVGTLHFCKDLA